MADYEIGPFAEFEKRWEKSKKQASDWIHSASTKQLREARRRRYLWHLDQGISMGMAAFIDAPRPQEPPAEDWPPSTLAVPESIKWPVTEMGIRCGWQIGFAKLEKR